MYGLNVIYVIVCYLDVFIDIFDYNFLNYLRWFFR